MNSRTQTRPWQLVARREVVVRLTDRAFLAGTVLTLALILAAVAFSAYQETRSHSYDIAVSSAGATALGQQVVARAPQIDEGSTVATLAAAKRRRRAGHGRVRDRRCVAASGRPGLGADHPG